jgi:hypothetical protein
MTLSHRQVGNIYLKIQAANNLVVSNVTVNGTVIEGKVGRPKCGETISSLVARRTFALFVFGIYDHSCR